MRSASLFPIQLRTVDAAVGTESGMGMVLLSGGSSGDVGAVHQGLRGVQGVRGKRMELLCAQRGMRMCVLEECHSRGAWRACVRWVGAG
ncbi:hypothetical protein B0H13DRAFT_1961370 [Mycena leptocephala]|nr:hypothetical protein B0H13DRAFT_1961370 [Mycena leptocephala]